MGTTAADKRRDGSHPNSSRSGTDSQIEHMATSPRGVDAHERSLLQQQQQQLHKQLAPPGKTRLTLERVLGVTSLSNAMLAVNPVTGEIAYAAGCIVVIYNLRRNKQVRYYRVEKSVSCLCFSPSGQYLAIGEKGYLPAITIWDGHVGTLCAELQMHKYGVACMAFSRDGNYLLSAGLVHDQHMYAWKLSRSTPAEPMVSKAIAVATVSEKILAMDYSHEGNFFVTVGEKHFKYWFLDADNNFLTTGYDVNDLPEIQGRSAVMAAKEDATFTSVGCGYGVCKLKTFAITSDGTLCSFGVSCVMERLVSLEAACGNAISVTESYVAVGGASSVIRLFEPSTLEYKATMPFPPAFGKANEPAEHLLPETVQPLQPAHPRRHPAAIGVRLTGSHVVALYSDHSLFIYDIGDPQMAHADRSFLFHSGCVRDLQVAGRLRGINGKGKLVYHGQDASLLHSRKTKSESVIPQGTFVTCSDDNTVRFWHLDAHKPAKSSRFENSAINNSSGSSVENPEGEPWKNPFSQEMLDIIYYDDPMDFDEDLDDDGDDGHVVLGGTCSWNDLADIHTPAEEPAPRANAQRALAFHPNLTMVVAGDKEGNLVVRTLPLADSSPIEIAGHASASGEINCVAFGEVASSPLGTTVLLAAGGRDRMVHVHDGSKAFAPLCTLDNHSGAVTSVAFTRNGKKLITCGADKSVVFSDVALDGKITRYNSVPFTGGKIYDVAVTSDDEFVVAACNNRLDLVSVATGKHVRTLHVGEQHRIDICPANFCVAMSGSLADKTIHIVDLANGETLADGSGHGEGITGIKFTPDCRRLVTSSSDGCVFVWRLAEVLQNAIKARLPRVTETAMPPPPLPPQPTERAQVQAAAAMLMPPPAPPPIPQAKKIQPPAIAVATAAAVPPPSRQPPSGAVAAGAEKKDKADAKLSGDFMKKENTRGWKGKAKAIPGPMAKVPMEDWMRTRESAKKTAYVMGDEEQTAESMDEKATIMAGALQVDRSKTPDWAKTFLVAAVGVPGSAARKSPRKSPPKAAASHGSKWAQRTAAVPQAGLHEDDDLDQLDTEEHGELGHLSLAKMDVTKSAGLMTTSLALEREQLDKRRKQLETAKAVAEMNSRLGKMGLLRNNHKGPGTSPVAAAVAVASPLGNAMEPRDEASHEAAHDESQSLKTPQGNADEFNGIPAEMFESIELPRSTTVAKKQEKRQTGRRASATSSIDLQVNQSMSVFTSGFAADASLPDPNIGVDQSLSAFSGGYTTTPAPIPSGEPRRPERTHAPATMSTSQVLNVGASLSVFTEGFTTGAKTNNAMGKSMDLSTVAASMSVFTEGYTGDATTSAALPVDKSLDLRGVAASLSNVTSGYLVVQETTTQQQRVQIESVDVAQSLSSFTSGFTSRATIVSPVRMSSAAGPRVDESLSTFTSGYVAAAEPVEDLPTIAGPVVASSLSSFTSGYEAIEQNTTPSISPAIEQRAVVLSSISDLDQQLQLTEQVLKSLVADTDAGGAEVDEIRELMARLRDAVERFAMPRRERQEEKLNMSLQVHGRANTNEASSCRVYVGNLPWSVQSQDLQDHMSKAGEVIHATVLEINGRSKGCGIVEYASANDAQHAMELLNASEMHGRQIFVREDRGNHSRGAAAAASGRHAAQQSSPRAVGEPSTRVYVGNLSWAVKSHELQDHMKTAGTVTYCEVMGESTGRSKGFGLVEFATAQEAERAIQILTNTELDGRKMVVREDQKPSGERGSRMAPVSQHDSPVGDAVALFVGNLPWDVTWQMLKDLFRSVGEVERTEVATFPDGKSRGFGLVRFVNASDALQAIQLLNGTDFHGRAIEVRHDKGRA